MFGADAARVNTRTSNVDMGGTCNGNAHASIRVAANLGVGFAAFICKEGRGTLEENLGFGADLIAGGDNKGCEVASLF
jgi:hypothetical protein